MKSETFDASTLAISIVSHGQGALIRNLLQDLQPLVRAGAQVLLTLNLPEDESSFAGLEEGVLVIRNPSPLGFGANHNQACSHTTRRWFAVLNPDIRCDPAVFGVLTAALAATGAGLVAPRVTAPDGRTEDSARRYPSVPRIASRVVRRLRGERLPPDYALEGSGEPVAVDWAAGMFLLFESARFRAVGGFDTRYFMYLEDADICRRLGTAGRRTLVIPAVSVVHDARRATGRSLRHLRWHLASMARFLFIAPWTRGPRPLQAPVTTS